MSRLAMAAAMLLPIQLGCGGQIAGEVGDAEADIADTEAGPDAGSSNDDDSEIIASPPTEPIALTASSGLPTNDANVNCRYGAGGGHTVSHHYRAFATNALPDGGVITEAILPIEVATSPEQSQPASLSIHRLEGDLLAGEFELIDTVSFSVPDQSLGEVRVPSNIPFLAGDTLVVQVSTEDGLDARNLRFGYNLQAQTSPTYFSSESCGIPLPTDLATLDDPANPGQTFAANSWLITLVAEPTAP